MMEAITSLSTASKELRLSKFRNCAESNCDKPTRTENSSKIKKRFTVPGTKWCGVGYKAENYSDLGTNIKTDMCCREHDHCDVYIESFNWRYGLFNSGFHTAMDCHCDERFRNCLIEASQNPISYNDKVTADAIGKFYFNFLQPTCLKKDYPYVCMHWGLFACTGYKRDLTQPMVWYLIDSDIRY
ncbi:hypothetical protein CHS0354_022654 [Potamilus streckersoni]|uniref:Phospholipase A2-like central domain-containing protein n=1 Tax=Potamilus streckersoni TaxID=2493646 RepID=A0AAE0TG69_9BIVA|nr:hypothetical protein CHS0354_022654 [Potamilus streckersoni]